MAFKSLLFLFSVTQIVLALDTLPSAPGGSDSTSTVKGGIVTAVGAGFFDNYKNVFLQKFLRDVQEKPIADKTWIVNIDALDAVLNATFGNFKVTNASYDDGGTLFTLQEPEP